MPGLPWLFTRWPASALSLLLLGAVSRQAGLGVVRAALCTRWGAPSNKTLSQHGDVIIGGLINMNYIPSAVKQDFVKLPHYEPCTG